MLTPNTAQLFTLVLSSASSSILSMHLYISTTYYVHKYEHDTVAQLDQAVRNVRRPRKNHDCL